MTTDAPARSERLAGTSPTAPRGARRAPGPLRPGARVALVAPAGAAPQERLEAALAMLRSWGLEPVAMPSATARHPRADYLSGPDEVRARDIQDAWCDPEIEGIFCLRGGYGAIRTLEKLDVERMRSAGVTPLFGSSDITALHEWIREMLGAPTWFAPMPSTQAVLEDPEAARLLRQAVFDPSPSRTVGASTARTLIAGSAEGMTIGGNLSLLAMTIGARSRPLVDNADTIVLLEDVTEETYKIDGYLQSLLRAGWFDGVQGVVLGSWAECSPVAEIEALAVETLGPLGIPVIGELGFGHGPASATIALGVRATMTAPQDGVPTLTVGVPPEELR
ncbi:MAG: LD-carboxypeptidase [Nakamurella sp.]